MKTEIQRSAIAVLACFAIFSVPNHANANVVGSSAQNFNPTTNGLDFVTVQSSETLKPGIFNVGLFLNYAVNSLPYYENAAGSRTNFTDRLTSLDVNAGMGLMRNWDFGISIPQVLSQQVDDGTGTRGEFAANGVTEVRLNTKYRFFGDDAGGAAVILSTGFNMIQDNPFAGRGAGPTTNFELAVDTTVRRFALGANFGYRLRSKGEKIAGSIADPLGSQWIASAAASYHFPGLSTKLITEVFGGVPAETSNAYGDRSLTSFEWLLGLKHDVTTQLAVHAGGGTELIQGQASPDWRLYAGLNYSFGPIENDSRPARQSPTEQQPVSYLETVPTTSGSTGVAERLRTRSILFEFDSDKMIGRYDEVLRELAGNLRTGFKKLTIEGHTDSVGPDIYNLNLSNKRALAIRRRLIDVFNISADKVRAEGRGEAQPIADNGNYQGRQANRRVEFEIER